MKLPKLKFVDLSVPIKTPNKGEIQEHLYTSLAAEINYQAHADTVEIAKVTFGCTAEDIKGIGWSNEIIRLASHAGTHVDAPYHYYPTTKGEPAMTITECPLEWFFGEGIVLDMTHKKNGETVSIQDVKDALDKIDHTLKYGDIVCMRFDADKEFGTSKYWTEFPGMSPEATLYILEQGVKVIGTDAIGFDIPFDACKEKFLKTKDPGVIWEAHRAGKDTPYCHIEKLANLKSVPSKGFYIACFPVHIFKASAGWSRVVGLVPVE